MCAKFCLKNEELVGRPRFEWYDNLGIDTRAV
jgi:hypothetical protein